MSHLGLSPRRDALRLLESRPCEVEIITSFSLCMVVAKLSVEWVVNGVVLG